MSGSVNRVTIVGRLTRDPEGRSTQDGTRIVNLNVATSESWKTKAGERKERSEFHRVVIFNERLVEVAEKYLRKGSMIYIEGALQTRSWDKDGEKRYSTEIVLARYRGELTMLDPARSEERAADEPPERTQKPSRVAAPYDPLDDGEPLPF